MKNTELDFITTEEYTKEDIQKVQYVLMQMAKNVHKILDKHNIPYFIAYGTLIGAARHEGFIPWDDDFDVFLFEETYEQALGILRKELPEWIVVHDKLTDPIYWPAWSRLRDKNSSTFAELYSDDNHYKYTGINLDLYKIRRIQKKLVELDTLRENLAFYKRKHSIGLLSDELYREKTEELTQRIQKEFEQSEKSKDEAIVYKPVSVSFMFEEECIFPLRKYKFEDFEFWGPNNSDLWLKTRYGDYRQLPGLEERKPHYKWVHFEQSNFDYSKE